MKVFVAFYAHAKVGQTAGGGPKAPNGVAYVSYNTLPGWGLPGGVRKFLLLETARHDAPQTQLTHAGRVLDAVAEAIKDQPGSYAANLRDTIADMRQKVPGLLFHDELAEVNEPCKSSPPSSPTTRIASRVSPATPQPLTGSMRPASDLARTAQRPPRTARVI